MTRKRDIYLEDLPMSEAVARLNAALERAGLLDPMPGEEVPLAEALGRVTAGPVWAAISAPHYHASAMDGYAVRSRDTQGASETNPVSLHTLREDDEIDRVDRPAQALNTGHALPAWADSVIMVENVQPRETGRSPGQSVPGRAGQPGEAASELIIRAPVAPWQHVRPMGEDMVATELVLPANHTLRPVDLGALGGSGHATVSVRRRPRVAVIPTGSELVSAEDVERSGGRPEPGKIVEFNSLVLAAQVETWGGAATRWPIVPDDNESIKAAVVEAASSHDLVLINAGSSAGTEDWTAQVIRELGEVLVHGIAVRPGHPVIFGMVASPPNPLSTGGEGESQATSVAEDGGEADKEAKAYTPQTGKLWEKLKPLAREKRHEPTPTEELLWQSLRNRKLGGLKFRRQHAIGRCIVDFFCADHSLIVEVDGPIHERTREYDAYRQEYLASFGMRMLRVTANDVTRSHYLVLAKILAATGTSLTPVSPAPQGSTPPLHEWRGGGPPGPGVRRVPILGVPGYPVSAALTGEIFVEPLISRWLGRPPYEPPTMQAAISRKIMSPPGDDDYVRVTVGQVGDKVIATPLSRGAGVITSLVRADGIVRIPRFSEGVDAGAEVRVHLYRPAAEIARTIVHIGSHDMTLDLLAQFLAERAPAQGLGAGMRLSSANVGSLGGLVALKRGEAHLAGAHLLDPETGEYNWKYIGQYLPDRPVTLVTLVGREQGLIVAAGNPLSVKSLDDLTRADVTFVNRQRGAGTRLLLDYELGRRGIRPEQVSGYEREEYTHLAVAAAVASGTAICGLGVRAAARALDLDFVPVGWERYDLVIPQEFYEGELLRPLLDLLKDEAFRAAVGALEGYDVEMMGRVVER